MNIILFDIDGTLLSSGGAGKAAMVAALESAFGVTESSDSVPLSGRTDRQIGRDLFQLHGVEDTEARRSRFVAEYLRLLPDCLNRHPGRVLPGIAELLDNLSSRDNAAVGLLTGNLREGARLKLSHYQLYEQFNFGAFGDDHLTRDDVAREALALMKNRWNGTLDLDRVWVVGDTPLDVQCARAIGVRVAAVATGQHSVEVLKCSQPDLLFEDLVDAAELLNKLG